MTTKRKVLVYGAGGGQGGAIVSSLIQAGYKVRVTARSKTTTAQYDGTDVEVVRGDLEDVDTLIAASQGVDAVSMNLPIVFDLEQMNRQGRNIVDAAVQAGVQHIVYNSSICAPDQPMGYEFFDEGVSRVIEYVRSCVASAIVLRPPLYVDNVRAAWTAPFIEAEDILSYAIDDRIELPWMSFHNLGQFVVAAIERTDLAGEVFDIAWPEPFSSALIAKKIGDALGREIRYEACTPRELANRVAPAWGEAAADHVDSLYSLMNANDGALTKRDYQRAISLLKPDLESLDHWAIRCFRDLTTIVA